MSGDDTPATGLLPVLAALSGNTVICMAKFAGFLMSGSATLFAEVIHSIADIFNQLLLLVGVKRSQKKADASHNYGYGQERFFWAVVSACGVFFVGAGVTVYHGIHALLAEQTDLKVGFVTVGLLIFSLTIELVTLWIAFKELRTQSPDLRSIFTKGDPTTIAIVFEDSIATLGIIIALGSLYLTSVTGNSMWDALGSIIVGLLLGIMAIVLVNLNRSYLIEKAMPSEMADKVRKALAAEPVIETILDFKTSTVSLNEYRVAVEAEIDGTELLRELYADDNMEKERAALQEDADFARFAASLTDRVARAIGRNLRQIEIRIQDKTPEVKYLDIEIK